MRPKALVTREILPKALDYLKKHVDLEIGVEKRNLSKAELLKAIRDKEGLFSLLVDEIDKEVMDAAPSLKIISNCAVGYNNIDISHAKQKGIMVTNTPGVLTETTADLTWALILSVARRIPESDRFTRQKRFTGWELDLFLGQDVYGKQLGIIGMGRIGKAVAARAAGFNMTIVYSDPKQLPSAKEDELKVQRTSLDELLSTSDIITLHTNLTPGTHHLLTSEKFKLMNKEAILINTSRGPVVDEKALVEALEKKEIWGAGLDVYEREPEIEEKLLDLENAVLLPHTGSASYETRLKMAMTAATNLVQGLRGDKPDNLVV
jgi:glyoxylate reductase